MIIVFQEPADILGREFALQRRGRVCEAEGAGKVRNTLGHHSPVGDRLRQVFFLPVS